MKEEFYHAKSFTVVIHHLEVPIREYIVVFHEDAKVLEHIAIPIDPFQRIVITSDGEVL